MKSKILELFGLAAKDKSPEEIKKMALDAADAIEEPAKEDPAKGKAAEPAKDEDYKEKLYESIDDEALDAVIEKLAGNDGFMEKLMAKMAAKKAMEHDEDPIGEVIEKLTGGAAEVQPGGGSEDEEAHVVPAEEMDKDCGMGMDKALAAGILKAMRPSVAAIKDEKQRKAVSDALINCITAKDAATDIAAIMQAAQSNAKAKAKPVMDLDSLQALYDSRNPHKNRKETK